MPAFQDVQSCCGVKIIYGFETETRNVVSFLEKLEKGKFSDYSSTRCKFDSYYPNSEPAMYIIFLDGKQHNAFSKVLEQYGFELKSGPVNNPKMKYKTKIFMYVRCNSEEWVMNLIPEEYKQYWKILK
jgi:hypothetical protein